MADSIVVIDSFGMSADTILQTQSFPQNSRRTKGFDVDKHTVDLQEFRHGVLQHMHCRLIFSIFVFQSSTGSEENRLPEWIQ